MRDVGAEHWLASKLFMLGGALFVLGLIALAIGTEIQILSYWATDPVLFWIWQGAWAIVVAIVISTAAKAIRNNTTIKTKID